MLQPVSSSMNLLDLEEQVVGTIMNHASAAVGTMLVTYHWNPARDLALTSKARLMPRLPPVSATNQPP
jgi:hypothetical protein